MLLSCFSQQNAYPDVLSTYFLSCPVFLIWTHHSCPKKKINDSFKVRKNNFILFCMHVLHTTTAIYCQFIGNLWFVFRSKQLHCDWNPEWLQHSMLVAQIIRHKASSLMKRLEQFFMNILQYRSKEFSSL